MTSNGHSDPHDLSAREREVVELIAGGGSNKEIAERLGITERTVKAHLTSVFQKLGLSSRLQLAVRMLSGASTNGR
jgi:two-component system, NarL family, nitrate/nitrite response regulator NarL